MNTEQRAGDIQLIRDSWQMLWSGGRKQYRADGRGLLIIVADKPPVPGQGYLIYWLSKVQLKAVGVRDAALIALVWSLGARRSELARLTIADIQWIDEESGDLVIKGKGDKERNVYVYSGGAARSAILSGTCTVRPATGTLRTTGTGSSVFGYVCRPRCDFGL